MKIVNVNKLQVFKLNIIEIGKVKKKERELKRRSNDKLARKCNGDCSSCEKDK